MSEGPGIAFAVISGICHLALVAVLYGVVLRSPCSARLRCLMLGGLFGAGAILSMMATSQSYPYVLFDGRQIMVGFAGAFAGIPAAIMATLAAVLYRIWLGGPGMPYSVVGLLIATAAGVMWRFNWPAGRRVDLRGLAVLGSAIACYAVTFPFMPDATGGGSAVAGYFLLGFGASLFCALILGSMMQREVDQIERERSLRDFAYCDPLTGLANRRAFTRRLASLEMGSRDTPYSLLLVDVDHFKSVNDTYGHGAGDLVLRNIAKILRGMASEPDLAARFGGEEFVLLMPGVNEDTAHERAEALRLAIANERIDVLQDVIGVTISIGLATTMPSDNRRDLVAVADEALYRAKEGGRNRTVRAPHGRGLAVDEQANVANRAWRDRSYPRAASTPAR